MIGIIEIATSQAAAFGSSSNLRTVTTRYFDTLHPDSLEYGRVKSVLQPDNQLTSYNYERGTFTPLSRDFTVNSADNDERITITNGTSGSSAGIGYKTT